MNSNKFRKTKGFTLVELLVVISILAILAGITIITYTGFIKQSANSSDMVLVNQLNTLLKSQRVFEDVDSDNDLAILLQNYFGNDVNIASQKYDMDIYYNDETQEFELKSNDDGKNLNTLDYYLSRITFMFNKDIKTYDEYTNYNNNNDKLESYLTDEGLFVEISINDTGNIKTPSLDLYDYISGFDCNGNKLELGFEITEIDVVQIDTYNFSKDGSIIQIYTPGIYQITYNCQDFEGKLNLYVKNVFWPESPKIDVSMINPSAKINENSILTVKISNLFNTLKIQEYDPSNRQFSMLDISNNKELLENIIIIINYSNQSTLISMDKTKSDYTITLNSLDLNTGDTISIVFRYRGYNGEYVYSEEKIITVK